MSAVPSGVKYGGDRAHAAPGPGEGRADGLLGFDVPQAHGAVHAAGRERAAVTADRHGVDLAYFQPLD
jgi:hypothetical protein